MPQHDAQIHDMYLNTKTKLHILLSQYIFHAS